jgi:Holliday junction DNA helicase RuvB
MREKGIGSASPQAEEQQFEVALRPKSLADFTGQKKLKENLSIAIEAARQRGEAMDHVLLYGPPGLGKTTLAHIIAAELGVEIDLTSGPVIQKKLDLTGMLSNVREKQVYFVDEIHRLLPDVEEMLYSALEDFRVDIIVGQGPGARTHSLNIPHFTAIGATTRMGMISAPLRGRFSLLGVDIDRAGSEEVAKRARGTPRIANRLLRRVRDYAQVRASGHIDLKVATTALNLLEVDPYGLDEVDRKIMRTILTRNHGAPVGLNTIAASVDEEAGTIEEVYEPYLMEIGFLDRTPRGRCGTEKAFEYFGIKRKLAFSDQGALFE